MLTIKQQAAELRKHSSTSHVDANDLITSGGSSCMFVHVLLCKRLQILPPLPPRLQVLARDSSGWAK
jgi:hypothetical protein